MLITKSLPIAEIFGNTIQGEGPRLKSAIFIRSALCCFNCKGFGCKTEAPDGTILTGCDTIRAVSTKFKNNWTYYNNFLEIVNKVNPLLKMCSSHDANKKDIIWTGGEPLIHWKNKIMQDVLAYYISRGHKLTIETNASLNIDFFREYQKEIIFSMSVKLSCSGESKERRINLETITKILENCKDSYLKFVINPETFDNDIQEIQEILENLPYYANVYLMPLGETREKQLKNIPFVFDKCAEYGFSFSPRVHILAYNDKEGI